MANDRDDEQRGEPRRDQRRRRKPSASAQRDADQPPRQSPPQSRPAKSRPAKSRPAKSTPPKQKPPTQQRRKQRPPDQPQRAARPLSPAKRSASSLLVRPIGGGEFELLHPRCALERGDDIDDAREMIAAGEIDIAIDELRYLLSGCHDFIDAHRMLGELALVDNDLSLARGHFGIAYQLGVKALGGVRGTLPYRLTANQSFHESGKGLVWCLAQLDKRDLAAEVVANLLRLDPADPLAIRRLAAEAGVTLSGGDAARPESGR